MHSRSLAPPKSADAGLRPSTASEHLSKLLAGGLVVIENHGRHRYYRIAGLTFPEGQLGIDVSAARGSRRHFARACLDWTERQYHLAGALGAALLSRFLGLEWLERTKDSRALRVTAAGRRGFRDLLGIDALEARYG